MINFIFIIYYYYIYIYLKIKSKSNYYFIVNKNYKLIIFYILIFLSSYISKIKI